MSDPQTVYEWFARSAAIFGQDCVALEVDEEHLTYDDLRDLAERLAARLVAVNGGDAPRRVGLLAGRSVTAYAGYLAILRTGAAVVPLNPGHPPARTADIVKAAGLDMALADAAGAGAADPGTPLLVIGPEELAALRAGPLPEPAHRAVDPDDVAYIIFTSGSTGTPKGVPILHRNLAAYLGHVATRYDVGPGSRLSQTFDLTFDGSVHDLFVAWASGGTLVVPRRSQLMSPVKTINDQRLTHWFSVPSLITFASRLGTLKPGAMPTLRWSVFGGEPLHRAAAEEWQAAAPGSTLEVLYGPTELTVSCTAYRLPRSAADWPDTANGTLPIGTAYPTLDLLLLDENGRPADTGELCVRGPQRFPGYLEPANNAGRFLPFGHGEPVPTATATGTTAATETATATGTTAATAPPTPYWYRTGDRATMHDGHLVHLGRTDHQVKIRGHRIELGEIEAMLREQPGVRDAVVLAVQAPDGEPELKAAVSGDDCAPRRLYSALGDRLPPYMLPSRIAVLDQLPLNPNGKIDRHALLAELGRGH
ncbi:amino acid adenylation domain-containing protein [Streptomyces sp. ISL-10]|uniref:amino acid adenylation domain-containing protein n=1 Tax=Streptomyces sp. ISL-10 TaxID=2819172 RepID=UPI001BEA2FAA|nr:amino acid adenylation domain-containing protein [Streptomyces sp. ISL-10]MBT2365627.1 amino acid adenylation domain-containing protein [Streptomyces sp. ISL-10]